MSEIKKEEDLINKEIKEISKDQKESKKKKKRYNRHFNKNHSGSFNRGKYNHSVNFFDNDDKRTYIAKAQTLDLEVYAGAKVTASGLFPIAGKDLKKKSISIDYYKEVSATANGALNNMATAFSNVDINLATLEADTLDYLTIQLNASTYAQLPTPGGLIPDGDLPNNQAPTELFPGYEQNNTGNSYTTLRSIEFYKTLQTLQTQFQTNQAFATLAALQYQIVPYNPGYNNNGYNADQNPVGNQFQDCGLLGGIDGLNSGMLLAVCRLGNIRKTEVLIDYFIRKHAILAPYLKAARARMRTATSTALIDTYRSVMSYLYCDIEGVEHNAKILMALSRANESIFSPLVITDAGICTPQYQLVGANGEGIPFSYCLGNHNANEGAATPYYTNHYLQHVPNLAITLLQDLQNQIGYVEPAHYNPADLMPVVNNWYNNVFLAYLNQCITDIQYFKTMSAPITSLIAQSNASKLSDFKTRTGEWDIEMKVDYVPEIAIPLSHPEAMITNVYNNSAQFPATIALEGDRIEKPLVDSTRWYDIAPVGFFSMQNNEFDGNVPQYMLYLQYNQLTFADDGTLTGAVNAAVAPNNTVAGIYQLPNIIMYDGLDVYTLNGCNYRFRHGKNYSQPLYSSNQYTDGHATTYYAEQLTGTGMGALSNGEIYVANGDNNGGVDVVTFVTNFSNVLPTGDEELIPTYGTSSFTNLVDTLGIFTTDSASTDPQSDDNQIRNYVATYAIKEVYKLQIPVTMRSTTTEMINSTLNAMKVVKPTSSEDVNGMTQLTLK